MKNSTLLRKIFNAFALTAFLIFGLQSFAQSASTQLLANSVRVQSIVAVVRADSPLSFVTTQELYDLYRGRTREIRGVALPAIHLTVASDVRRSFSTEILRWKSVSVEISRIRAKVFAFEGNPPTEHPDESAVFAAVNRVSGIGYIDSGLSKNLPSTLKAIPILEARQ